MDIIHSARRRISLAARKVIRDPDSIHYLGPSTVVRTANRIDTHEPLAPLDTRTAVIPFEQGQQEGATDTTLLAGGIAVTNVVEYPTQPQDLGKDK